MSPCAKRTRVFRRKGGESPGDGEAGQGRPRLGGARLHKQAQRSAEGGRETVSGRAAPSLDAPGCPLNPVHARSTSSVTGRCQLKAAGRRTSGWKGQRRPKDRSERAAREHAVAAGEVP